jgi:hypothetical protein
MKQETLEEDAERYIQENIAPYSENKYMYKKCFIEGAQWQQERSYSEEEVLELLVEMNEWPTTFNGVEEVKEWFKKK